MLKKIKFNEKSENLKKLIMKTFNLSEKTHSDFIDDLDQIIRRYMMVTSPYKTYFIESRAISVEEGEEEIADDPMKNKTFEEIFNKETDSVIERIYSNSIYELDMNYEETTTKEILEPLRPFVTRFLKADENNLVRLTNYKYENIINIIDSIMLQKSMRPLEEIEVPKEYYDKYKKYYTYQIVNDVDEMNFDNDDLNESIKKYMKKYFDDTKLDERMNRKTWNVRIVICDEKKRPEIIFDTDHEGVEFTKMTMSSQITLKTPEISNFVKKIQARIYAEKDLLEKLQPGEITNSYGDKLTIDANGFIGRDDDLPSVITSENDREWRKEGILTRENGPAVIWSNGKQEWYENGNLHREDGPAVMGKEFETWAWATKGDIRQSTFIVKSNKDTDNVGMFVSLNRSRNELTIEIYDETGKKLNETILPGTPITLATFPRYTSITESPSIIKFTKEEFKKIDEDIARIIATNVKKDPMMECEIKDGLLHAEGRPAVVRKDGTFFGYFTNGLLNRTDGPAYVFKGNEYWMQNGVPHRADGPAVILTDGYTEYWNNGELQEDIEETNEQEPTIM